MSRSRPMSLSTATHAAIFGKQRASPAKSQFKGRAFEQKGKQVRNLNTYVLSLSVAVLAGCASTVYNPPNEGKVVDVEFNAQFFDTQREDSAQILAFKDPTSCENHPRGVFVGLLCPSRPGYACNGLKFSKNFEADVPVTLKIEYKFGDITNTTIGTCNNQLTFSPKLEKQYRMLFDVGRKTCGVTLQQLSNGNNWVTDNTVTYDQEHCIWF